MLYLSKIVKYFPGTRVPTHLASPKHKHHAIFENLAILLSKENIDIDEYLDDIFSSAERVPTVQGITNPRTVALFKMRRGMK